MFANSLYLRSKYFRFPVQPDSRRFSNLIEGKSLFPLPLHQARDMAVPQSSSAKNHLQAQVAPPQIWWANAVFFILVHIAAFVGLYHIPPWSVRKETLLLWFLTWQLSDFGYVRLLLTRHKPCTIQINSSLNRITIGYHRLYSHKAFRATLAVRVVLAILGSCAFQGSIKASTALLNYKRYCHF